MRCLHCGKRLSIFKKLQDSGFCSEEHRLAFQQQQSDFALARLMEAQRRIDRPAVVPQAAPQAPAPPPPPPAAAKKAKDKSKEKEAQPAVPFAGLRGISTKVATARRKQIGTCEPIFIHQCYLPQEDPKLPPVHFTTMDPVATIQVTGPAPRFRGAVFSHLPAATEAPRFEPPSILAGIPIAGSVPLAALTAQLPSSSPSFAYSSIFTLRRLVHLPAARLRTLAPVLEEVIEKTPAAAGSVTMPAEPALRSLLFRPLRLGRLRLIKIDPRFDSVAPQRMLTRPEASLATATRLQPLPTAAAGLRFPLRAEVSSPTPPELAAAFPAFGAGAPAGPALPAVQRQAAVAVGVALSPAVPAPIEIHPVLTYAGETTLPRGAAKVAGSAAVFKSLGALAQLPAPPASPAAIRLRAAAHSVASPGAPRLPRGHAAPAGGLSQANDILGLPAVEPLPGFSAARLVDATPLQAARVAPAQPVASLATIDSDTLPTDAPFFDCLLPVHPGRPHVPASQLRSFDQQPIIAAGTKPFQPRLGFSLDRPDGSGPTPDFLRKRFGDRFRNWWPQALPGVGFLHAAPADLKWIGIGLPAVLLLLIYSALPTTPHRAPAPGPAPAPSPAAATVSPSASASVPVPAPASTTLAATPAATPATPSGVPVANASRWNNFQQAVSSRAAVNLTDDFRSGLGAWQGQGKWAESWKYTQAQFVEPGALALYSPTLPMADYSLEFLGQIGRRSLNWVFRAKDFRNYYAMRLVLTKPGPLPQASIVRYAVIDGKEGPARTLPLPMPIKGDTLYRVRMEVKGDTFTTYVQGQVVDNFTDDRLATGGIGFFTPPGDRTLLRWVEVSYQYDFLGRLCALVAPYGVQADGRISE